MLQGGDFSDGILSLNESVDVSFIINEVSEALLARQLVSSLQSEIDPVGTSQFGLVAEDVEKVNANLIVRVADGTRHATPRLPSATCDACSISPRNRT
jgi:hypothetical protein